MNINFEKKYEINYNCKAPITSYGIIVYNDKGEFLLIRRKDSLGYVDFLRGKYNINDVNYIQNLIDEMTIKEKHNILANSFKTLWNSLWMNEISNKFSKEEINSKDKFNKLKDGIIINNKKITLKQLINNSKTNWSEPEWGFPKGRRNFKEKNIDCAIREFCEETGYNKHDISIIQNVSPFNEIFTGSDYKSYKHVYFLAKFTNSKTLLYNNRFQKSEVSKLEWVSYKKALEIIRPYNYEKIKLLKNIKFILNNYEIKE